jgi:hypothetical protein
MKASPRFAWLSYVPMDGCWRAGRGQRSIGMLPSIVSWRRASQRTTKAATAAG